MLRYLFVYSTYNKISSLFPNYNVNPFHFQIRSSSDMSIFTHCRRLSYINLRYLNKNGSDSVRPLLELNNISYSYHTIDGETKALSDISFQLAPGEFAAVVGPSGCGKSTLLSLIAGLIEAENGTIFLDGEPSEKSFRKSAKIGYMLQHDHLFEHGFHFQLELFFYALLFFTKHKNVIDRDIDVSLMIFSTYILPNLRCVNNHYSLFLFFL